MLIFFYIKPQRFVNFIGKHLICVIKKKHTHTHNDRNNYKTKKISMLY